MKAHIISPGDILVLRHSELERDVRGIVQNPPTLVQIEHDPTDDSERLVYLRWREIRASGARGDPREAAIEAALALADLT